MVNSQYSAKADIEALRKETAQAFADTRRHMYILIEDLKTWMKPLFEDMSARIDLRERTLTARLLEHDRRIENLAGRVTRLESRCPRTRR